MDARAAERGAALTVAVMLTSLVGAIAAALVFVIVTESRVGRNHASAQIGAYAAAAGIERAIGEVHRLPAWQFLPSTPSGNPAFNDASTRTVLSDGVSLDLTRLTVTRQNASDTFFPAGANRPVWTLYAHAPLARMTGLAAPAGNPYVVVWVADDPAETDGDPSRDSNGVVLVRAEAFGVRGAWRAVEATLQQVVVRDDDGLPIGTEVIVVAWRDAR